MVLVGDGLSVLAGDQICAVFTLRDSTVNEVLECQGEFDSEYKTLNRSTTWKPSELALVESACGLIGLSTGAKQEAGRPWDDAHERCLLHSRGQHGFAIIFCPKLSDQVRDSMITMMWEACRLMATPPRPLA